MSRASTPLLLLVGWLVLAGTAACAGAGDSLPGADLALEAEAGDTVHDTRDVRDVRDFGTVDPGAEADAGPADVGEPDVAPDLPEPPPEPSPEPSPEAPPEPLPEPSPEPQPEPLPDVPEPAPDLPEPSPEPRPEPLPDLPDPAPDLPEPSPDVPDPSPEIADAIAESFDPGTDAADPRCDRIERWGYAPGYDVPQNAPTCLDYVPDGNFDATWCEFWPDAFAVGHYAHYGIPFDWLEATLRVEPSRVDGTVLDAGMWILYENPSTFVQDTRVSMGRAVDVNLWQVGFTYLVTGVMGEGSYHWTVRQFAFFLDVRRPGGAVDRLWQSDGGANWTLSDAFTLPSWNEPIPYGYKDWSDQASTLFDPRRACTMPRRGR